MRTQSITFAAKNKKSFHKGKNIKMKQKQNSEGIQLKTLTKSNVWDLQENDVFRMLEEAEKDTEVRESLSHFLNIIRVAFQIEEITNDIAPVKAKYERLEYKVGEVKTGEQKKMTIAIKKRPIKRVTDLTYENIHHISVSKLIEVLESNFGGGWDSLSQSVQDIIESRFDISTTTLPKDRLHKVGGMYEKKVNDGYEVLEVPKGGWVEAIFVKEKPEMEKPRFQLQQPTMSSDEEEDDGMIPEDTYNKPDEDDMDTEPDDISDEDINEENYRTTFTIETGDETGDEVMDDYEEE